MADEYIEPMVFPWPAWTSPARAPHGTRPGPLHRALQLLQRLPSQCAVCHAWPAQRLCPACRQCGHAAAVARCTRCAAPVAPGIAQCGDCLKHPPPLDACLAAVGYGYPWADLLTQFKFGADPGWAAPLGALLRDLPGAAALLDDADALVPIPLSTQRLRQRGYNQALLLARQLDRAKVRPQWLERLHDTPAQSRLTRAQRLRNLRGAFATAGDAPVAGLSIVLIDDVMTTGATLYTAASVLRGAGARSVNAIVLARTD